MGSFRPTWIVALVALPVVACGTRVGPEAATGNRRSIVPAQTSMPISGQPLPSDTGTNVTATATDFRNNSPNASGSHNSGAGTTAAERSTTTLPTAAGSPVAERGSAVPVSQVPSPRPEASPAGPGLPTSDAGPALRKAPIVFGNVGTFSGPVGAAFVGAITGTQAWVRLVNDGGGIEGHLVKVISADDGGDPARAKANAKDLIERQGAVAFLADYSPITRSAYSDYIREKQVPVLGGDQATVEFHSNPMYFPAGSFSAVLVYGAVVEAAKVGKKRLAFLYCAEIPDCQTASDWARQAAEQHGMQLVYTTKISLAQPDYTAECLQAKRFEADVVYPLGDPNTFGRFTRSCDRQNYHPLYINAHSEQDQGMASDTGLQGGLLGAQPQVPWFLHSETPAIAAYRAAKEKYAPGAKEGQDVMVGWVSGKMVEKALLAARPLPGVIKSADVLRGLWTFSGETLLGLVPPMSFTRGQPAAIGNCWFTTSVIQGKWTAPNGASPSCEPLNLKV